jgi:hypothetical protein
MNEEAHRLATSSLSSTQNHHADISPPSTLITLRGECIFMSKWQSILQERAHAEALRQTICRNNKWCDDQFDMVDWAALKGFLKRQNRSSHLAYIKLLHDILNTNTQNNKFYRSSDLCPHCHTESESFLHVLSCPHPEVSKFRSEQQEILWKALAKLNIPISLVATLKKGLSSLNISESLSSTQSPSFLDHQPSAPMEVTTLLHEAYIQQTESLGWDNFFRGRISRLWGEAYFAESMTHQRWANKMQWAARVVEHLLCYSKAVWRFRCSLLHGLNQTEMHQKIVHKLQEQVKQAYQSYRTDPFIVNQAAHQYFLVHVDSLQCFLRSYSLAKEQQELCTLNQAQKAARFFPPRSLPTTIQQLDNEDISTCTNVTGLESDDSDLSVSSLSVSEQNSTESHSWRSTSSVLSSSLDPDSTSCPEFINSTLSTSSASPTGCTMVAE